ncbi:hypothetical protein GUJ93_ZPchr0002g23224 [Zizania palustris]|uniref:SEC7 domain-containing protein n=1 Tax=Zizania palustris TaxID=103762 RepID=A0A8J5VS36_ZIZPA|nr:hypothetical protein GUJ93_ZPchr0002g23224 [Zizania palustris]
MASPVAPIGGASPSGRVLGPALDRIIKNAAWRKHSALVAAAKAALDVLSSSVYPPPDPTSPHTSPLLGLPAAAADACLHALLLALESASPKVADPALDCVTKLLYHRLLLGDLGAANDDSPPSKLLAAVLSCGALADDTMELSTLRALVAAARCPSITIRGEGLGHMLKPVLVIVFARVEVDSVDVRVRTVSIMDMMDMSDRNLNDSSIVQVAQSFINEAMEGSDAPEPGTPVVPSEIDGKDDAGMSNIREDGLTLFKNLCKLSMKFSAPDNPEDQVLLRGKVLSLELLKMVIDNAGAFWRTNERYLGAIKQYLCLSLLKNSALSAMSIFQLLCSIFVGLLSRFRSGLKEEIGIFFPMLVLRVLENVHQPSFLQKMTILNLLEKICKESQVIIDIFVNYDCDVDAPNIFERIVNGLLKTALGVPPGSATTLTIAQDQTFRIESVKCLATVIKSMGSWMDQQLRIGELSPIPSETSLNSIDNPNILVGEDGSLIDFELQSDSSIPDLSGSSSLEQRRAYKIEIQKGISLFNRKPSKGIDFLIKSKKIAHSPEDVASFLRNTSGLNATMIGDYLGERDEFPIKVMHAYADALNFEGMDFGEAISADTAYVLAYSVIMLNTDAHNTMVKDKMSKSDFIRNNRGIDDGKDLPEAFLSTLYDQIVKNEIKMSADSSAPQSKQPSSVIKLLGLDNIINLVNWKHAEDKALGANDLLIKNIQEKFKAKSGKSESIFHAITDTTILRFMMETQRDAFVTSVAKFTYLHCAADMKQKNVDAVKAIISIAIEDGDYLQDSWEHVLTCLSRFEHLHLLGEGAPTDASFLTVPLVESEEKTQKSSTTTASQRTNALQNPAVMAAVRGGSYDSTAAKNNRLDSDAIVAFVKALCKVSMTELHSPTEPRIFCLTKIVEIAHYNMNRIRLVWSHIWKVLSDFFVSVGLSENLSVAIFVMDSLRQLAMKFLEREELANYNFQNEFLQPFAVVMQKSNASEVRELIVRCISQMVLSRVSNIKSGWKSVFMVFTAAAADDRRSIVLLAFETMEKIVRDYFPYITETETTTFTDCVKCLITFTSSKFSSDASLNAIAFLRFCAVKLAEEGFVCHEKDTDHEPNNLDHSDGNSTLHKDEHVYFWVPLLAGLARLTTDTRPTIRKGAVEVLFDILKDHGHLFSQFFWRNIFESVIYPLFGSDNSTTNGHINRTEGDSWNFESKTVAVKCLVDLYITFFDVMRPELSRVTSVVVSFIRSPYRQSASTGFSVFQHLTEGLARKLSKEEWKELLLCFKQSAAHTFVVFDKIVRMMQDIEIPDRNESYSEAERYSDHDIYNEDEEEANMETASYAIVKMKNHMSQQLLVVQGIVKLYETHRQSFCAEHMQIILEMLSAIASHASEVSSESTLNMRFHKACSLLEVSEPAVTHFENESYESYLKLLQALLHDKPSMAEDMNIESQIMLVSEKILRKYLNCTGHGLSNDAYRRDRALHWILPLDTAKKEELSARTSLVLHVMRLLGGLERVCFRRNLSLFSPLLANLIRCEHSSGEVQLALYDIFQSSIGPIISV